ncbi:MAG: hypothetical protein CVV03_04185 [Firmicutes bacterium HGW-Firmicutes-8]|nr:MAG: hypothetical protein CVV03_04185 [Firmicutes bacterium HGW-Firmicutes-8]
MAEYVVEVNKNNSIDLPGAVLDRLALEPGDKIIMRFDNTGEHVVMGKLPMDSGEKAEEMDNVLGQRVKIKL